MNEYERFIKIFALLISSAFLLSALGSYFLQDTATTIEDSALEDVIEKGTSDVAKSPVSRGTRAPNARVVLAEYITNTNCTNCTSSDPAIDQLADEYDSSQLAVIYYHYNAPDDQDPFFLARQGDNLDRIEDYYGVGNASHLRIDGNTFVEGADSPEGAYSDYKTKIDTRLAMTSNLTINVSGSYDSNDGYVNARIEATDNTTGATLRARFAVVEDNIFRDGTSYNGIDRHRYVMRDMLVTSTMLDFQKGDAIWVNRSFPLNPSWNLNNLEVVVFVQTDGTQEVIQAGRYDYIPQDILIVDDDQSSQPLGDEDEYQELLCYMGLSFDSWPLGILGSPSSDDLSIYNTVIWLTGNTWNSTLTTSDQSAISSYLDGGSGNLFLIGENIGADIGATAFYSDYLYASFLGNDTNENWVNGVSGDPVSDLFYGTTLPISNASPSQITPISPANPIFTYSISGDIGGIKAFHDSDSKVVYFAFLFFENFTGRTSLINRSSVMQKVLDWLSEPSIDNFLNFGWNLISFAYPQINTNISSVLVSINGEYDAVQWYNASDKKDPWKHNHTSKPSGLNDLGKLNHTMGFWIHITNPSGVLFDYNESQPINSPEIPLFAGWNLVGFPSNNVLDTQDALNNLNYSTEVDSIWTYNAQAQIFVEMTQTDLFRKGKGYWFHTESDLIWQVPQ
jgi:thiol-disulfide isomerase/thioredoxin